MSNIKYNIAKIEEHIDSETGFRYRHIKKMNDSYTPHRHEFFELLFFAKGLVYHNFNEKQQIVNENSLIFIRKTDRHSFCSKDHKMVEHINLAFTEEHVTALFNYLGTGFPSQLLLSAVNPPMILLSEHEKEKLMNLTETLTQTSTPEEMKTKMRTILVNIFTKYFNNYSEEETGIPLWLETLYEEMQKPKNFEKGIKKMYEKCHYSPEYLSRCMKKYYNTSPTNYINMLRLEHSKNLLLTTNFSVTDICYECGFETLSNFYRQFKKSFGMTPKQFRKTFGVKTTDY